MSCDIGEVTERLENEQSSCLQIEILMTNFQTLKIDYEDHVELNDSQVGCVSSVKNLLCFPMNSLTDVFFKTLSSQHAEQNILTDEGEFHSARGI